MNEIDALAQVPTTDIRQELHRRQGELATRFARRDRLRRRLAELDNRIKELQQAPLVENESRQVERAPARMVIPPERNSIGLSDAIALEVEAGERVTPSEVEKRVRAGGFITTAKTFRQAVSLALSRDRRFRRVSRGIYERIPEGQASANDGRLG